MYYNCLNSLKNWLIVRLMRSTYLSTAPFYECMKQATRKEMENYMKNFYGEM